MKLNLTMPVFSVMNRITSQYYFYTSNWEFIMVLTQCMAFMMFKTDKTMILTVIFPAIAFTFTYLFISYMSNAGEDAFFDIANSLYGSKWYWMSKTDQKVMLTIMIMAQQSKSLVVSIFGKVNLERFTKVRTFDFVSKKISINNCFYRPPISHIIVA